jgi:hypothetical protein
MSNRICHFKLVLLGDTAVGKSCLVVRFVRDEFFEFQEPTIGGKRSFGSKFVFVIRTLYLRGLTNLMEFPVSFFYFACLVDVMIMIPCCLFFS